MGKIYIYKFETAYYFTTIDRYGLKKSAFMGQLDPFSIRQSEVQKVIKNGVLLEYHENGKIKRIRNYVNDSISGTVIEMDSIGTIVESYFVKSDSVFERYKFTLK
ncbi:MAG: hypothetical protein IPP46_02150 [Bacteroidetes bacterium]|nr:hypothetical protein [Bacteroidota bacterium]